MPNIALESLEGKIFHVDTEIAKVSITIKTMLEDIEAGNEEEVIPIPNIKAAIMKKVIEWMTYHKGDAPPPEDDEIHDRRTTDDIIPWDANFVKVDQTTLLELILAANYLDIKGLLDVTCKTVARMLKDKTVEEIRKTFNIENDFTPAEEERIIKENEWCEEK